MVHRDKMKKTNVVQKIAVILDNGLTFSALDPLNNLKSLKYMFIHKAPTGNIDTDFYL